MTSFERRGLDLLLQEFPDAEVVWYRRNEVWLCVDLLQNDRTVPYAIFRHTGAVYRVNEPLGDVADDPFLVPEGSSYDGPREVFAFQAQTSDG